MRGRGAGPTLGCTFLSHFHCRFSSFPLFGGQERRRLGCLDPRLAPNRPHNHTPPCRRDTQHSPQPKTVRRRKKRENQTCRPKEK